MASKKRVVKSISSLQKRIDEHRKKIEEYDGSKSYLLDYWEKEISEFERRKKEKQKKLE
ncbi:MAG TPA: hypothetical protein VJK51_02550 [Candidatus Nanoarchaeia archaeon]|nr:hypothetical protein [Candidatus Nanoarchaeia archaeon]